MAEELGTLQSWIDTIEIAGRNFKLSRLCWKILEEGLTSDQMTTHNVEALLDFETKVVMTAFVKLLDLKLLKRGQSMRPQIRGPMLKTFLNTPKGIEFINAYLQAKESGQVVSKLRNSPALSKEVKRRQGVEDERLAKEDLEMAVLPRFEKTKEGHLRVNNIRMKVKPEKAFLQETIVSTPNSVFDLARTFK